MRRALWLALIVAAAIGMIWLRYRLFVPKLGLYEDACFDPEEVEPRSAPPAVCYHSDPAIRAQLELAREREKRRWARVRAEISTLEQASDECDWQVRRCSLTRRCWRCGGIDRLLEDLRVCTARGYDVSAWRRQERRVDAEITRLEQKREAMRNRPSVGLCE